MVCPRTAQHTAHRTNCKDHQGHRARRSLEIVGQAMYTVYIPGAAPRHTGWPECSFPVTCGPCHGTASRSRSGAWPGPDRVRPPWGCPFHAWPACPNLSTSTSTSLGPDWTGTLLLRLLCGGCHAPLRIRGYGSCCKGPCRATAPPPPLGRPHTRNWYACLCWLGNASSSSSGPPG